VACPATEPVAGGGTVVRPKKGSTVGVWLLHPANAKTMISIGIARFIRQTPFHPEKYECGRYSNLYAQYYWRGQYITDFAACVQSDFQKLMDLRNQILILILSGESDNEIFIYRVMTDAGWIIIGFAFSWLSHITPFDRSAFACATNGFWILRGTWDNRVCSVGINDISTYLFLTIWGCGDGE
jgi:hypothetical protein